MYMMYVVKIFLGGDLLSLFGISFSSAICWRSFGRGEELWNNNSKDLYIVRSRRRRFRSWTRHGMQLNIVGPDLGRSKANQNKD